MEGRDVGCTGAVRVCDIAHVEHVFAAGDVDGAQVKALREAGITVVGAD